jgi:hypothetical protein
MHVDLKFRHLQDFKSLQNTSKLATVFFKLFFNLGREILELLLNDVDLIFLLKKLHFVGLLLR